MQPLGVMVTDRRIVPLSQGVFTMVLQPMVESRTAKRIEIKVIEESQGGIPLDVEILRGTANKDDTGQYRRNRWRG